MFIRQLLRVNWALGLQVDWLTVSQLLLENCQAVVRHLLDIHQQMVCFLFVVDVGQSMWLSDELIH